MRMSQLLAPTLREEPAEAESDSHRLMLRAGLIRKSSAGIYTYLPLAFRSLRKISEIVREEMDRAGGQELQLPIVQPAELWVETGRWYEYGPEMFRLKDRHGREFCLGPTHEEIITALVRAEVRSYRQLPLLLYQIQNKYRDEIRPRFGVIRGREFIMKDLYSFDRDEAGLEESYRKMYEAYSRAFHRCGLSTTAVEADPGAIGGDVTHEFMVLSPIGEAQVVHCRQCGYAANVEAAPASAPPARPQGAPATEAPPAPRKVSTPGVRTIEDLVRFLGTPAHAILKTLLYEGDGRLVAAVIRGDHQLNEVKLARAIGLSSVQAASPERVREVTGAPAGFVGPVGLNRVEIVADPWAMALDEAVTGANEEDAHLVGVVPGRHFSADRVTDIRLVVPGDPCPRCGAPLDRSAGIEVGQIFKLHTKYSEALGATFLDEDGKEKPVVMGCYGIGITRTLAAVIEQHHDDKGIIWPVSVAPYHAVVVPVNVKDRGQIEAAERLYHELTGAGVETVLDDREERPGVKFNDADLMGFPYRVTVGARLAASGQVEIRRRSDGRDVPVSLDEAASKVREWLREDMEALQPR
ncbi:proline--tRNA ligase [Carboxydochorda subterranea]|uniref:Proline--tRNA ligase n=1 Tax=Carboxydichorda subterranea TaxID=3109565 RepID=A0ABZ1C074_9FIRM|nr:proline--tRNA ligase [Limnochorda sp. L945t]WRP18477.1 proline--tRNA ligase [Limnochorda sp. L945t]